MNEESSDSCSTCDGSHDASCYDSDEISLNDSDVEWTQHATDERGHLFYLKTLDTVEEPEKESILDVSNDLKSRLGEEQGFRSSYNKLTSWVFDSKRFGLKKSSLKRKSSKRSSVKRQSKDKPIEAVPTICVSESNDSNLVQLILGATTSNAGDCDDVTLMYLTPPDGSHSSERDCLVFSYPQQESDQTKNPVLFKLKGMLITMSQVVCKITNQYPILSTIEVTQKNQEKMYYVGFVNEFSSLLALAFPIEEYTALEIRITIETITKTICFLYNSLDAAFKNENNHNELIRLIKIIRHLLKKRSDQHHGFFLNTIPRLFIDDDLNIRLNDSMSEYEAMDWLSEKSFNEENGVDLSQEFIVIGSCLVFRSHLVTSHLPAAYLSDVISFLRLNGLLDLQSLKLVIWKEVHPASLRKLETHDFVINEGVKYFLVVVGIKTLLHCILIEMPFISREVSSIKPNQTIINESIKFLMSLLTKTGISDELEQFFNSKNQPNNENDKSERKRHKSLSSLKELMPSVFASSSTKQTLFQSTDSLLSFGDDSSVSGSNKSHSSPSLQHSMLSQNSSSASICQSATGTSSTPNCQLDCLVLQKHDLPENLICYMEIESGLQMISSPVIISNKEVQSEVEKQFNSSCFLLSNQLRNLEGEAEVGMMFEVSLNSEVKLKKTPDSLLFYVIGYIDFKRDEFYGCFQAKNYANFDVNIKEIAYNLRFSRRLV